MYCCGSELLRDCDNSIIDERTWKSLCGIQIILRYSMTAQRSPILIQQLLPTMVLVEVGLLSYDGDVGIDANLGRYSWIQWK